MLDLVSFFKLAIAFFIISSCATFQTERESTPEGNDQNETSFLEKTDAIYDAFSRNSDKGLPVYEPIPIESNPRVDKWMRYYQTNGRKTFETWLNRGETIKGLIISALQEEGLPPELYFMSLIESGFNYHARSPKKATGPWQFVAGTAKMYGLKVNDWVDERRDPVKSTRAAAAYIRDLKTQFGDWYLALAAYNAGPGTIYRAIKKAKSRDYWTLSKDRIIRRETKDYIPKLIAAITLGSDPETYGFNIAGGTQHYPSTSITIERPVKLDQVAQALDIPFAVLRQWNPELIRHITPPPQWIPEDGYALRLSDEHAARFDEIEPSLPYLKVRDVMIHKIRKGETLSSLARLYKVSIKRILSLNPQLKPRLLSIGSKVAVPVPEVVEAV
ncbi:MAG: transglycosylase SLT domain-containing protein [Deltaproteobacteria bacterium]|nr:transglycosylase SLT domain-containing protein [Deltaproteobacteria bacterium]